MTVVSPLRQSFLRLALEGQIEIVGWTVEQYRHAIESGWLPEDTGTELIDGFIVRKDRSAAGEDPLTIGDRHRLAVLRLARLLPTFEAFGCFIQTQQPVALPPGEAPEPDAAVVRGDIEDYTDAPPGPADILCLVEVSDSSLLRDTTTKLRVYAAAHVPMYVVVDLQHDLVRVYRDPRNGTYPPPQELRRGDTLALPAGGADHVDIPVDRLL